MKLTNSKDFTKDEKKFIVYYTVSQAFLGVLLITLQIIFFYQVFSLFKNYKKEECLCPKAMITEDIKNESN